MMTSTAQLMANPFRLEAAKQYRIAGAVPLCPVHTDDLRAAAAGDVEEVVHLADPKIEVLEVRPRKSNGYPWYRVRLHDGRTGWINCVALTGREIFYSTE